MIKVKKEDFNTFVGNPRPSGMSITQMMLKDAEKSWAAKKAHQDRLDKILDKKYELTNEITSWNGTALYRIKALRNFSDVKAGDLGGFVKNDLNYLSHNGECWIYDDAKVTDFARVQDNAKIYGTSVIDEYAMVYGNAKVFDHAHITDNAKVYGNAEIHEYAYVGGSAKVYGNAKVTGFSRVSFNDNIDKGIITEDYDIDKEVERFRDEFYSGPYDGSNDPSSKWYEPSDEERAQQDLDELELKAHNLKVCYNCKNFFEDQSVGIYWECEANIPEEDLVPDEEDYLDSLYEKHFIKMQEGCPYFESKYKGR